MRPGEPPDGWGDGRPERMPGRRSLPPPGCERTGASKDFQDRFRLKGISKILANSHAPDSEAGSATAG